MFGKSKILTFVIMTIVFVMLSVISVFAAVDTTNASKGYITVAAEASPSKAYVVQLSKEGQTYNYMLTSSAATNIPLQLGSGSYKVTLLESVSGNQYRAVSSDNVDAVDAGNSVYTNSIQLVNFSSGMTSVQAMRNITASGTTDADKAKLLHSYLVANFSYDTAKAAQLASATSYVPNIEQVWSSKMGICYDISSVLAAGLRDEGIPTKLCMGYTSNIPGVYHAWNEIYLDGAWQVVDATYDIGMGVDTLAKDASAYSVTKYY